MTTNTLGYINATTLMSIEDMESSGDGDYVFDVHKGAESPYKTIQAAILAAESSTVSDSLSFNPVVRVGPGVYNEDVTISRSISLIGSGGGLATRLNLNTAINGVITVTQGGFVKNIAFVDTNSTNTTTITCNDINPTSQVFENCMILPSGAAHTTAVDNSGASTVAFERCLISGPSFSTTCQCSGLGAMHFKQSIVISIGGAAALNYTSTGGGSSIEGTQISGLTTASVVTVNGPSTLIFVDSVITNAMTGASGNGLNVVDTGADVSLLKTHFNVATTAGVTARAIEVVNGATVTITGCSFQRNVSIQSNGGVGTTNNISTGTLI
jgi:hypothetical protein